jgi:arginine-tRNA-protein transferase
MFAQVHLPEALTPHDLDTYLERGWFRMGQSIFTTNFLNFKDHFYSAIWLRVILDEYSEDGTAQKLFRQNTGFRIEIGPAKITQEKENLYQRYRQSVAFEPSLSLQSLLMGKEAVTSIFNTFEITLYDKDKLIATGFFDLGSKAGMGITSVYDPAYKKFSLGKYLIYLKMRYCKELNLKYFYPGYFVPGYSFFDYKLNLGKDALEFLQLQSQQWRRIAEFSPQDIPLKVMMQKLAALKDLMESAGIECKLLKYDFFDANLVQSLAGAELFDFPLFLKSSISTELVDPIVVFDIQDQEYRFLKCFSVWVPPPQESRPEFYSEHVLKTEECLFSTQRMEDMFLILKVVWGNLRDVPQT